MKLLTSTDLAFQLNDGKFEYNKRCGYVTVRPLHFISEHVTFSSYFIGTSSPTLFFVPEFKL